jgi:hypothetical protein
MNPSATPIANITSVVTAAAGGDVSTATILGGAGVGIGALSIGLIVLKFISSQFKPDADGKRPSISEVLSKLFGKVKAEALDVAKDVAKRTEEQAVNFVKDPKNLVNAVKDPNAAIKSAKNTIIDNVKKGVEKGVADNVPVSESSVVLNLRNQLLPNQPEPSETSDVVQTSDKPVVADQPVTNEQSTSPEGTTSIQIDKEDVEAVKQMLALMNKSHTIVETPGSK